MSRFQFDCEFCPEMVRASTAATVKERGTDHLEGDHYGELAECFAGSYAGAACRNDCGYAFPVGVDEVAGFDCPNCGHDHFDSFVQQYLYWRIEDAGSE